MDTTRLIKNTDQTGYQWVETLTRKWYFYFILFLMVFLPPLTSYGFSSFSDLVEVVSYVSDFVIAKRLFLTPYMPLAHIGFLLLFILLFKFRNAFGRIFSMVAGAHFLLITYIQAGARSDKYGLVLYPNAISLLFIISLAWFWEAAVRKTDYSITRKDRRYFWLAGIIAVFSLWNPDELGNLSPKLLITSTSPIAFCMLAPIYLAVLSIFPKVNLPVFRITSFISILVSIIMIGMGFFMEPRPRGTYWSLMHIPMLVTSVYCFILGFQRAESD